MKNRLIALALLLGIGALIALWWHLVSSRTWSLKVTIVNPQMPLAVKLISERNTEYFPLVETAVSEGIAQRNVAVCESECRFDNLPALSYTLELTSTGSETQRVDVVIGARENVEKTVTITWKPRTESAEISREMMNTCEGLIIDAKGNDEMRLLSIRGRECIVVSRGKSGVFLRSLRNGTSARTIIPSSEKGMPREAYDTIKIANGGRWAFVPTWARQMTIAWLARGGFSLVAPSLKNVIDVHPLKLPFSGSPGERLVIVSADWRATLWTIGQEKVENDPLYDDIVEVQGTLYGLIRQKSSASRKLLDIKTSSDVILSLSPRGNKSLFYERSDIASLSVADDEQSVITTASNGVSVSVTPVK